MSFFSLQTAFWIGFWLCLLVPSLYERITDPPGSFSLSGAVGCHCCRVEPYPSDRLPRYHSIRANEGLYWCFTSSHIADMYCGRTSLMTKQEGSVPDRRRPPSAFSEGRGDDSSSFSSSPVSRDLRRAMKNLDKARGDHENRDILSGTRNLSVPTRPSASAGFSPSRVSVGSSPPVSSSSSSDENLRDIPGGHLHKPSSEVSKSVGKREERRKKPKDDEEDSRTLDAGTPSSSPSPESNSNSPLSWLAVMGGDVLKDLYERFTSYGSPSGNEEALTPPSSSALSEGIEGR